MKAASLADIKKELKQLPPDKLLEACLRLTKFKKENKQLLTYLLFEADDEGQYIENLKEYIDAEFAQLNTDTGYYLKKGLRRVLRVVKLQVKFSIEKRTEVEVLLHFCQQFLAYDFTKWPQPVIQNFYWRTKKRVEQVVASLHPDLQHDYGMVLGELDVMNPG